MVDYYNTVQYHTMDVVLYALYCIYNVRDELIIIYQYATMRGVRTYCIVYENRELNDNWRLSSMCIGAYILHRAGAV